MDKVSSAKRGENAFSKQEKINAELFSLTYGAIVAQLIKDYEDINEVNNVDLKFPIIADADRKISTLYDMLDYQDITNLDNKGIPFTVRSVFIIDPKKTIRLTISYPASTGRNFDEILRVVDSLQLGDKNRITTPGNWKDGDDVIVHPSVSNKEAETLFPGYRTVKPYLRFATQPGTQKA